MGKALEVSSLASKANDRRWPVRDRCRAVADQSMLNLGLFGHLECMVNLDAEVPYGAFELRKSEQ